MRKILNYALVACAGLAMASCAQEDITNASGDGNVVFTAQLPSDLATRSFGDGYSATQLTYAVYQKEADGSLTQVGTKNTSTPFNGTLQAQVSMKLVTGKTYSVVFWAQSPACTAYTFNDDISGGNGPSVDVDYTGAATNDENRDAFFASCEVSVTGPENIDVKLRRPFAQVNFGTSDADEASVAVAYPDLKTSLTTTAYTNLSLLDGKVSGETSVTYLAGVPAAAGETFPVTTTDAEGNPVAYKYLSMDYLLVPATKSIADMTLSVLNGTETINTVTISSAPLQGNYRTNIYGQLLTSTDNFSIEIVPGFMQPDYNSLVWNGNTEPVAEVNNIYTITNPAQLAWISEQVNGGDNMAGKTITLDSDIDLNNIEWTPIGISREKPFNGSFNGNGHKISNLKIDLKDKPFTPSGLFGYVTAGKSVFQNAVIENVNISTIGATTPASTGTGTLAGYIVCDKVENIIVRNVSIRSYRQTGGVLGSSYANITGCQAENVDIALAWEIINGVPDNCDKGGGIAGIVNEGSAALKGNKVNGLKLSGWRDMGGLFGMVNYEYDSRPARIVEGNTVTNAVITRIKDDNGAYGTNVGEIIGRRGANIAETDNVATDVTIVDGE